MKIRSILYSTAVILFFFSAISVNAQQFDGDWLYFDEEIHECFEKGWCVNGTVRFPGGVVGQDCELGYKIDYIMVETATGDTIYELYQSPLFYSFTTQVGEYTMYTIGRTPCDTIIVRDTTAFYVTRCPPYMTTQIGKAREVTAEQPVVLTVYDDIYQARNGDCIQEGYVDSLKIRRDNGVEEPIGLVDTLIYTTVDTGYQRIQLWEKNDNLWRLSQFYYLRIYLAYDNTMSGIVYYDQNKNCTYDQGEPGIENRIMYFNNLLQKDTTDQQGEFSITYRPHASANGDGLVGFINGGVGIECEPYIRVNNQQIYEGSMVENFGLQLLPDCSELHVDISSPFLRRCFNSTYYVNYCNVGSEQADSAFIDIIFDPFLTVESSTFPWTNVDGQKYTFFLGDVTGGFCGSFKVIVYVDCENATLGQVHCTEAHIYPEETCQDTSGIWSGGNIEVKAKCAPDSVQFIIKNTGLAPTTQSLDYFIVEDDIIIFFQSFDPLGPTDSLLVTLPKNGSYYYLQSEQEPNHPFPADPSAFIEGCAINSDSIEIGFNGQFPINDTEPFLDIDCTPNQGSFDPNDKAAFPIGYGENHYITPGTKLEYMIRFQNTGTDTAFNIRVADTISNHLLLGTFNPLLASHPYTFEITPEGHVTFWFDNIVLPDSNVNEEASHGFIKFEIETRKDLEAGTNIQNEASIYFDFNDPIVTNNVEHQIEPDFVEEIFFSTSIEPTLYSDNWQIQIFPNPTHNHSIIELKNLRGNIQEIQISIVNNVGILIHTIDIESTHQAYVPLELKDVGIYFVIVRSEGRLLATRKIVKM